MKKQYTDTEIITAIKSGQADQVLQFLYDTTQIKTRAYILKNNGSEDEAQDIFQDAVLSFYRYVLAGKFDDGKSVDGFIFTISKNLWVNRVKQKSRMVRGDQGLENTSIIEDDYLVRTIDEERAQKIQTLLAELGEKCKDLLTYTIFYKMRMDEVAEKMGFSGANAAKTRNYKCKQKLIQLLKDNEHAKEWLYRWAI